MTTELGKLLKTTPEEEGIKIVGSYGILGRFDTVVIMEAPDEKAALKVNLMVNDFVSTQTMVAIPREEAIKLVE